MSRLPFVRDVPRRIARPRDLRGFRDQTVARLIALVLLALACAALPAKADTFTVTRADDPTSPPSCAPGDCTLRAAIDAANASAGADTITFAIPSGSDFVTIAPATPLPPLTDDATTIDGFTQPGASAGTPSTIRFTSTIKIHLKGGDGDDALDVGLDLTGDAQVVRGLAISHFDVAQLRSSGSDSLFAGNLVGVDPALAYDVPIALNGLWILEIADDDVTNTTIGQTALPNVVGGVETGVFLDGVGTGASAAEANRVQFNFIGFQPDGETPLPITTGIHLDGVSNAIVGEGTPPNGTRGNAISGFGVGSTGVLIDDSLLVSVRGNSLGGFFGAQRILVPVDTGVLIRGHSVGIDLTLNTVQAARDNGVEVVARNGASPLDVAVLDNRILAVGGIPIDLGGDGPTPNDPQDADTGPNGLLNTPALGATLDAPIDQVTASGTLSTAPNRPFFIDLVSMPHPVLAAPDGGPYYDAVDYLFTDPAGGTTDANGDANFSATFSIFELPRGFVPGAVHLDAVTAASSEATRASAPQISDSPSFVTFHSPGHLAPEDRPIAEEVLVERGGNLDEAISVTVRFQGSGTTIPVIPPGGLVLSWAAGDAAPKGITIVHPGGPTLAIESLTLTLSGPVNTSIYPVPSFMITRPGPYEPHTIVDEIFGRPRRGGMETPGTAR